MAATLEFVVPVHTADLELPAADRLCVQSVMDVAGASQDEVKAVIQGALRPQYHTLRSRVLPLLPRLAVATDRVAAWRPRPMLTTTLNARRVRGRQRSRPSSAAPT